MSERARSTLFAAAIAGMAVVLTTLVLASPSPADRVEELGTRIKCPVCQGESIANSPAQMARDMMSLVEERVSEGVSDAAIVDELLSSYSGAVLLDPPARGPTLVLWVAPGVVLLLGAGVIVWWRAHPGDTGPSQPVRQQPRSRSRLLAGGLALAAVLGGIVIAAGFFLQDREGPTAGVADLAVDDLSQVSNETMEAVVAANLDNPQINGMRLALADRYYQEGDYRSAFPHYLAVAESALASDGEAVAALVRLGWMAWEGNREAETAVALFDEAMELDPGSSTALYLKGRVLWCGLSDPRGAAELFALALADPQLSTDSRPFVVADLAAIDAGESCG